MPLFGASPDPLNFGQAFSVPPWLRSTYTAPGINTCTYMRLINGGTISKISYICGLSTGNVSLGVYKNSGVGNTAVPGSALAITANTTASNTTIGTVSLPSVVTVAPGDWIAVSCDSAGTTVGSAAIGSVGSALGAGFSYIQTATFPLPTTATPNSGQLGIGYILIGQP